MLFKHSTHSHVTFQQDFPDILVDKKCGSEILWQVDHASGVNTALHERTPITNVTSVLCRTFVK